MKNKIDIRSTTGNPEKIQRNLGIDYIRVVCVMWIICVEHITAYAKLNLSGVDISTCTMMSLSLLFFISGWCCRNKRLDSINEIRIFIKGRLIRLYPLYLLALVCMILTSYLFGYGYVTGKARIIGGILLIGTFISPPISTLYFVNILMLFFLITPLLKRNSGKCSIISLVGILALMIGLKQYHIIEIDERAIYYLPSFFLGVNAKKFSINCMREKERKNIICVALIIMLISFKGYGLLTMCENLSLKWLWQAIVLWILSWSSLIVLNPTRNREFIKRNRIVDILSYSEYCMFLFHRPLFSMVCHFYGGGQRISPVFSYIVVVPILVLVAFVLQKGYEAIIKKLEIK